MPHNTQYTQLIALIVIGMDIINHTIQSTSLLTFVHEKTRDFNAHSSN